jgi:hypothetical protein
MAKKLTIGEMRQIASERKGKCLSLLYTNANSKLLWECENGHQWEAVPGSIKRGRWCPNCAGKHISIDDVKKFSASKGGKCLSEKYSGCEQLLLFECGKGHQWKTSWSKIKIGHWCHICAGNKKLTLEYCQLLAVHKGGKCLSKEYFNGKRKLKWECAEGHQWETIPRVIRLGGWCKKCSKRAVDIKNRIPSKTIKRIAKVRGS